jgi:hypothetical protein
MRRIELMDRYSADSFEYKQDIYVDILLRWFLKKWKAFVRLF